MPHVNDFAAPPLQPATGGDLQQLSNQRHPSRLDSVAINNPQEVDTGRYAFSTPIRSIPASQTPESAQSSFEDSTPPDIEDL